MSLVTVIPAGTVGTVYAIPEPPADLDTVDSVVDLALDTRSYEEPWTELLEDLELESLEADRATWDPFDSFIFQS